MIFNLLFFHFVYISYQIMKTFNFLTNVAKTLYLGYSLLIIFIITCMEIPDFHQYLQNIKRAYLLNIAISVIYCIFPQGGISSFSWSLSKKLYGSSSLTEQQFDFEAPSKWKINDEVCLLWVYTSRYHST